MCECVCDVIYYFCNLQFFRIGPKLDQILLFLCLCDFCPEDLTFSPFSSVSVLSSSPLSSLCLLVPYTHPGFARFCPFPWRCDSSLLLSSSISLSCLHVFLLCCLFCDSSQETPKQQDRDTPDVHLLYQPQTTGALPPPLSQEGRRGFIVNMMMTAAPVHAGSDSNASSGPATCIIAGARAQTPLIYQS